MTTNDTAARPLEETPYGAYLYSYPHKTSYRPLDPPVPLASLWEKEKQDALSLYLHVPFCEARCGYCNLFSTARPKAELVDGYVAAMERQAKVVRAALGGKAGFARFAIGGGTPTFLGFAQLERLLDLAERTMGANLPAIPGSVEVSPATADREKLSLLRRRGISRISIGVQSFLDGEVGAVYRPQKADEAKQAIERIREQGFPTLNIDLIYGLPGQDEASFRASLEETLRFAPEEIYLYPLYVRPLTSLGKSTRHWDDVRLELYRAGRDFLVAKGYRQISMRMFRLASAAETPAPVYRCQEDGMIGLGTGARSYTEGLHYATPYAIGQEGVRQIIERYVSTPEVEFAAARHGIWLDDEDRRRRYAILSLLADGIDQDDYARRFGTEVLEDLPQLGELFEAGWGVREGRRIRLTAKGVERSDAIGPWMCSARVKERMAGYELR
ncbi:MAG: STM4012 family radical SAM protein [Myxococcales bacterium]